MQLICHDCWNYAYFEANVELLVELMAGSAGMIIGDYTFDDHNLSESELRAGLQDIVQYVLNQDADALTFDRVSGQYQNNYIRCARCGSRKVTKPYSPWSTNRHPPLEEELIKNHKEYTELRKERKYADRMPVVRKE